jgi:hypothetical protein
MATSGRRGACIPSRLFGFCETPRRRDDCSPQAKSLVLDEPLYLRRVIHEKARQEIAPVQFEGGFQPALFDRFLKRCRIAPELVAIDSDFPVAPPHDHVAAQRSAELMKGLTQCVPRTRFIGFGPEKGNQAIPAVEVARPGGGEIDKDCEPPWLAQDRAHVDSIAPQVHGAKRVQLYHMGSLPG